MDTISELYLVYFSNLESMLQLGAVPESNFTKEDTSRTTLE